MSGGDTDDIKHVDCPHGGAGTLYFLAGRQKPRTTPSHRSPPDPPAPPASGGGEPHGRLDLNRRGESAH